MSSTIAEFSYSSLDGRDGEFALVKAFVDQLIDANVTAGTKWTSILIMTNHCLSY